MDSRIRRRQAAQAARELMSGKVSAVEALADRLTARDTAANGTEAASRRASELVQRARCEGQQLVQQAHAALAPPTTATPPATAQRSTRDGHAPSCNRWATPSRPAAGIASR